MRGGVLYFDGQFDDSRLAVALLRTFEAHGGVALNAAPVTQLLHEDGRITGLRLADAEMGQSHEVKGKVVINAAGIFADSMRRMDDPDAEALLSPSQGVHLIVAQHFLPGRTALMVPKTDDGRVLFAVPWHDRTLIGTTDTPVPTISLEPRALDTEIDFILATAARYLNPAPTRADILSVFAGLRPLVKAQVAAETKSLSREHTTLVSESGLVTLAGGKWTTYRRVGQDVVDRAIAVAGLPPAPSRTEDLRLQGWSETPDVYGSDRAAVQALPGADVLLHPALPYTEAEVRWAVRHEQARTVEDVLARRTRALLLDAAVAVAIAPRVAEILAEELVRDAAWQTFQIKAFADLATIYRV